MYRVRVKDSNLISILNPNPNLNSNPNPNPNHKPNPNSYVLNKKIVHSLSICLYCTWDLLKIFRWRNIALKHVMTKLHIFSRHSQKILSQDGYDQLLRVRFNDWSTVWYVNFKDYRFNFKDYEKVYINIKDIYLIWNRYVSLNAKLPRDSFDA